MLADEWIGVSISAANANRILPHTALNLPLHLFLACNRIQMAK